MLPKYYYMKYFFYLLFAVVTVFLVSCKVKPQPATTTTSSTSTDPALMERKWKTIDSLEQKGLIASALTEAQSIKQIALQGNDSGNLVKALMYEYKFQNQLEEDASIKVLERLEAEISAYPEPARSVMRSLAAQWYSNYLQGHLWVLRSRTEFTGTPGADIRTWGIRHFVDRIQQHYSKSVEWEGLKSAKVEDFRTLLTEAQNTDHLRPTLYDILMNRALDFYGGTASFLTAPAYQFVLTDPMAFAPARQFADYKFASEDTLSNTWTSLQWYQHLLRFRLSDAQHESALIDADLRRLRFMYDHIIIDQKDSVYQNALNALAQQHANNPESSLIDYHRAELLTQQAASWQENKTSAHRYDYNKAIEICREAIRKYPDAYGSQLCKNLIAQIETPSINAAIESVNLPSEELLTQIEYRNLSSVHLKLVKLPESPRRWRGNNWDGENILQRLNQLSALKTWQQNISDGADHQPHVTEISVQALPLGHYTLLISDKPEFDVKSSTTGAVMFTVSELGYWYMDDRSKSSVAAVINRNTGQPMQGVKAEFFSQQYVSGRQRPEEVKVGEEISDAAGWVNVPRIQNQSVNIRLTKGDDELYEDEGYNTYRYGSNSDANPTTLFFSDRSIYRPGQKIFFKGYALEFDRYQVPKIVTGKKVEVILYDVNGQEQSKKSFTSNEFGTFAGQFDLPQGGLTGQMSISSSHGASRHYFQVEEYKRPKFEITYDTLKETVRLNENVTIKGFAKDYAGSAVANANVRYQVERVAFRPWWYSYWKGFWPQSEDRQVLVVGTTTTKADGSYDISFLAKPKAGADDNLMYRFEINSYVTDITGESHELSKTIVLNKQGFDVNIGIGEKVSTESIDKIPVSALNSDNAEVKVTGSVEVIKIIGPERHKRDRLWSIPDILTITEAEYTSRYPNYFIPGKEAMSEWKTGLSLGSKTYTVDGKDTINLSGTLTQPGYYKLIWKWKDSAGKELDITQFIMLYDESKPLPGPEVIHVSVDDLAYAPGQTPEVDLLSGISNPPKTIRIVERRKEDGKRSWFTLPTYNDKSIQITEDDRGGIYVHHLTAFNNRKFQTNNLIRVPWTNKDLQVKLKTWRDKMEPGVEETWTMTVSGVKQEAVTAEMLLSMYDASLDAFVPHQWQMNLYPSVTVRTLIQGSQTVAAQYWGLTHHWQQGYQEVPARQYRDINVYGYYPEGGYGVYGTRRYKGDRDQAADGMVLQAMPTSAPAVEEMSANKIGDAASGGGADKESNAPALPQTPPPLRSALDETVFFFPQIKTDDKGNLTFSFKMKEGLTRWKFQALGHTKDLAFGLTQSEVVTQKDLMVFPNPPRFFREGDTLAFQIKLSNLTNQLQSGNTQLKIVDAISNQDVSAKWGITNSSKPFSVTAGGSTPLSWMLNVPKNWITPVKYQVSASAGNVTDGEESMIPVVTNRILITETLPLPMKAKETKTFVFKSMMDKSSTTRDPHQYTVEMTTSPAWYAVQALPYLMEYPHECAEQVFSRLYANTLASHIANKYPAIQRTFETWRKTNDDALLSNLQKNQELKSAMLEETPWVRDAMAESTQKKDIAILFETNTMRSESQQALVTLWQMQLANGAFSWFPGGTDNWYITQYIVEGFGHLRKMNVSIQGGEGMDIVQRAVPYIDGMMIDWYDDLKRLAQQGKIKMEDHQIGNMQIHYLYARSFFPEIQHSAQIDEVINYVKTQSEKYWLQHSLYEQGLVALGFNRTSPNNTLSKEILASLREKTIVNEELGRYWKQTPGFYWYQAPVELQSLMIELYQEMKVPQAETDELRVWLLKQKQTTRWNSTKSTAAAIYALLIHPDTWLESSGIVEVKVGTENLVDQSTSVEPGTGYVKKSWDAAEIKNSWSSITVKNPNNHIAWGAAYYQYWEDLDKVDNSIENNPLKVSRELLISKQSDRGDVTSIAPGRKLRVGDKLIVRLIVETDRVMEFVHLKDVRASGFEPMDVISGYRWNNGVGYYQSTKDMATHFFIDYLPRGKYIIEYPVTVAQAGSYSEGLATLQCMYAPEFSDHSQGQRVKAE